MALVERLRPTHLLHLAWFTQPGLFWRSVENLRWAASTLDLVRAFYEAGGVRVVSTGTCAEYDWSAASPFAEDTPLKPDNLYGWAKTGCYQTLSSYAESANLSFAWARLFFVYGPHEDRTRLIPHATTSLLEGSPIVCRSGNLVRDYMYVEDCATALVSLVRSDSQGPFNVCTGKGVSIREIVDAVQREVGSIAHVETLQNPRSPSEVETIIGANQKLREATGWEPAHDLHQGLRKTIAWWRINQ